MRDHAPRALSTSTLTGNEVRNASGDKLGEIKDFVVDLHDGRIIYAVLDFGGFLGIGNKLFAVPWQVMTVNTIDECCNLDMDKEFLENSPGFDKDDWPSHADYSFVDTVYSYYGLEPYPVRTTAM